MAVSLIPVSCCNYVYRSGHPTVAKALFVSRMELRRHLNTARLPAKAISLGMLRAFPIHYDAVELHAKPSTRATVTQNIVGCGGSK